jgi:hypothetical protein
MNFEKLEYQVGEIAEAPQLLEIEASGHARYYSHTNETTPGVPEIGIYETSLSAAEMDSLEHLLEEPPIRTLPDHSGRVRSGELYRRLRVTFDGAVVDKLVGPREPVVGDLNRVFERMEQIVTQARSHPFRVMRMDLQRPGVENGRVLTVEMTLSNRGQETVKCRNPLAWKDTSSGWFFLEIWPGPPAGADAGAVTVLTPNQLEVTPGSIVDAAAPVLVLERGASASFRVSAPLPGVHPGNYVVRLHFASTTDRIQAQTVLRGELLSKTVKVTVP